MLAQAGMASGLERGIRRRARGERIDSRMTPDDTRRHTHVLISSLRPQCGDECRP